MCREHAEAFQYILAGYMLIRIYLLKYANYFGCLLFTITLVDTFTGSL